MAIQHVDITDPHIHEPRGASSASANTVYVADGSGSGNWIILGTDSIDTDTLLGEIQDEINSGDLELTGSYFVTVVFEDVSTADSIIIPVINDSTVLGARLVLGGAITTADANVTFLNATGASMGSPVVIANAGSAKGTGFTWTATGNNTLTGPSWFEVATDGASDGAQKLSVTIELGSVLNQ